MTHQASQDSVGSIAQYNVSTSNLAQQEQFQRHITLKDQEIVRLRSEIEQISSELFQRQQENDGLIFTKSQL